MTINTKIDYKLPQPVDAILESKSLEFPIPVVLKTFVVSHEETEAYLLDDTVHILKTPLRKQYEGSIDLPAPYADHFQRYVCSDSPCDNPFFDKPFTIVSPYLLIESCYIYNAHKTSLEHIKFQAVSAKYPKKEKDNPSRNPITKAERWRLMEEFEIIATRAPVWPGDLISKKRAKILEDAGLIKRDKEGKFILTPNGHEIYSYWRILPEEY